MMRFFLKFTLLIVALSFMFPLMADQVRMKDGTVKMGEVIEQNGTNLVLRYKIPGNITKEEEIPAALVQEVAKDPEDRVAYQKLEALLRLGAFSLPLAQYNQIISNQCLPFLEKYTSSPWVTNVQQRLEMALKERDAVAGGWIKFAGRWYSSKQAQRRKFDFESYNTWLGIVRARQGQNWAAALSLWEAFERQYAGSMFTPFAMDEVILALTVAQQSLKSKLQSAGESQAIYQGKAVQAGKTTDSIRPNYHVVKDQFRRWEGSRYGDARETTPSTTYYGYTPSEQSAVEQAQRDARTYSDWSQQAATTTRDLSVQLQNVEQRLFSIKNARNPNMERAVAVAEKAEALMDAGQWVASQSLIQEAGNTWSQNHLTKVLHLEWQESKRAADARCQPIQRAAVAGDHETVLQLGKIFLEEFSGDEHVLGMMENSQCRIAASEERREKATTAWKAGQTNEAFTLVCESLFQWPKNHPAQVLKAEIEEARQKAGLVQIKPAAPGVPSPKNNSLLWWVGGGVLLVLLFVSRKTPS